MMEETMKATHLLLIAALGLSAPVHAAKPKKASVEVVFVIDTTGSMGGLLESAKQKIWSIANEIAKGKPAPDIKMGLVAYRDKSDSYVTKSFDLTNNLDAIYKELLALKAGGGGDGPEHVLKGLQDAIEGMSWSADRRTFKVVYLVGDAPAHLDYNDTPKLAKLTEAAVRRGLVLNTIQCGSNSQATTQWRQIARFGEGRYLPIPHNGGVATIETPFDDRLSELNRELDGSMLAWGRRKGEGKKRKNLAMHIAGASAAPAAADRAVYKAMRGFGGAYDLAEAVEEGEVDLDSIKKSDLPDEFKDLSDKERKAKLSEIKVKRDKIRDEIVSVNKQRSAFIKKQAKSPKTDSFDAKLVGSLKEQAAKAGIKY
jgi:Mg-chelatase subunit ChlD